MYTTPSYNQHILYGDALHNLKRKNYKNRLCRNVIGQSHLGQNG
jgi:hypothetical protein